MACRRMLVPLFLVALLTLQPVMSQDAAGELAKELEKAVDAQQNGEEAPPVIADIVQEAPEAVLANGDGDVSTIGDCATDIESFCGEVKPGERRLAECLSAQKAQEEKGNVDGKTLTDACKQELALFYVDLNTNINKNLPLAQACKDDAAKFCSDLPEDEDSAVQACLRERRPELSPKCAEEVFKAQQEGAADFRADAELHEFCKGDADSLCKDVTEGAGKVQECLREKRSQVTWDCQEELFRQEMEGADDIRLSLVLLNKCMSDKKQFCNNVKAGNARVKDCLEEHRDDTGFSPECKEEFEKMMARRAMDFRLDSNLRELCANDIESVCSYEKEGMDNIVGFDARVINCLQDFRDDITEPACQEQVHKLTKRAAQNINFDVPLADACFEDRARLCESVQPGSARVIRCLQDKREQLSLDCRATLFDQEVRMAEDIDFKYPMKRACAAEIGKFCTGMQHGRARIIRCLQDHSDDEDMSGECKAEVQRDMIRMNSDYRLNFRLSQACFDDINALCASECPARNAAGQSCGGKVLRCLTEKQDAIKSEECQKEVFYFEKMEVTDFRNDVILAEACRTDVDTFCKNVQPGEGRVHSCLREKMEQLTDACRKEELKLNIIQSRDIRLRPKLNKLCSEELAVYCKDVVPGKGRMFKCLQENLAKTEFGQACRDEIMSRETGMQEDYRLDYGVSSQCGADIDRVCAVEKGKAHGHAEVLKCLVQKYGNITEPCQVEMSRAVRMALWEYRKGAALTGMCDADVDAICPTKAASPKSRGIWTIGAVGRCLSRQLAQDKPLQPDCRQLVITAAPKDVQAMFDHSLTASQLSAKIMALQQAAGITTPLVNPNGKGASFVTLTGWVALAAMCSLFIVIVGSVLLVYRRWTGKDQPYEVITKEGDV